MFPFAEYYLQSEMDYRGSRIRSGIRHPLRRRRSLRAHLPGGQPSRPAARGTVAPSH